MEQTIILSGELDIYALADVERAFASLGGTHVRIDLRDAHLVSAAFFGALVRLRRRLPHSRIEVTGANPNVRRTFSAVGAGTLVTLS